MDNKSVILPKWIDKIIFDDFEAVFRSVEQPKTIRNIQT